MDKRLYDLYFSLANKYGKDDENAKLLQKILLSEESGVPKSGIKMSDFVLGKKEANRPALTGVYYDNGKMAATDSTILVVLSAPYPEEWEGKIITPDGDTVNGKYPNYNSVRPTSEMKELNVDWEGIADEIKNARVDKKTGMKAAPNIDFEGKFKLSLKNAERLLKIRKNWDIEHLRYKDERSAVEFVGPNYWGVVMPRLD